MADISPRGPLAQGQPPIQVKVLRLQPGITQIVRTLATTYKGLFVHFLKKTGEYCPGREECRNHHIKPVWKGYTPVEVWVDPATVWEPWVLEVSESLDQDFYNRFGLGQVWQVSKAPKRSKNDQPPLKGDFWEQLPERSVPASFDMGPALLAMYHVEKVELLHDNPMPRRLYIAPSKGAPPRKPSDENSKVALATPDQVQDLRAFAQKLKKGVGNPEEFKKS